MKSIVASSLLKRDTSDAKAKLPTTYQRTKAKRRASSPSRTLHGRQLPGRQKVIATIAAITGASTAFILLIYAEVLLLSK
ncbi:MAG: hypothetical protein ACO32T_08480 [Candidatus Nanopelagicaceae bacterium]